MIVLQHSFGAIFNRTLKGSYTRGNTFGKISGNQIIYLSDGIVCNFGKFILDICYKF